ncbi:MAG: FAD-binding protein [Anaerolineae bacterium]|nr:FAD-binding protein [Anaerolineae bacterium]
MSDRKRTSRRRFIAGTAVAGAGALATVTSRAAAQTPTPTAEATGTPGQQYDVVVAGSGLGGLAAALAAAQEGASVLLIEASQETGGTALFSGGAIHVWGAETFEDLQRRVPLLDPKLGRVLMENYSDTLEWLRATDVEWPEMSPALTIALGENSLSIGDTYEQKRETIDQWVQAIEAAGGEVLTGMRAVSLIQDDDRRVTGLRVADASDEYSDIMAGMAVILATGAFPANPEMMVKYYGPFADLAVIRAVPYNKGDAMLMGEEIGARMSRAIATYYGHLQAWPPIVPQDEESYEQFDKQLLRELMGAVQGYEPSSVLVNMHGRRFVDESLGDDIANQELIFQPLARGFMIVDSAMAVSTANLELLEENGGVVLAADSLDELVQMIAEYGIDSTTLMSTLDEYNQAIEEGTASELSPARSGNLQGLLQPPFYAVQVAPGVSASYGGLMINENGQVLGRNMHPIPGLYAAPHAAGGIFYRDYGGSLALCTVFGRIAGMSAAREGSAAAMAKAVGGL